MRYGLWIGWVALGLWAAGCGIGADDGGTDQAGSGGDYGDPGGGGAPTGPQDPGGEPEPENEAPVSAPQAGLHTIFLTDEVLGSLVLVDAATLEVRLVPAGDRPDVLAVLPGTDVAMALSRTSGELTVVDATPGAEPVVQTVTVPIGYNALSPSPAGDTVVAWYNAATDDGLLPLGPLQSVSVVRLADEPEAVEVSVGFEPRDVRYAAGGDIAYVVSRDAITPVPVRTVQEEDLVPAIALGSGMDGAVEREVLIAPEGDVAVVRVLGEAKLALVSLPGGATTEVPLPGEPTDLDLTPDGARAVVVLKSKSQVALVDLGNPETMELADVPGPAMGVAHITLDGKLAILSTADAKVERLAVLDLTTQAVTPVLLQKAVQSVTSDPTGRYVIVVHQQTSGAGGNTVASKLDAQVDASPGYSIVDLQSGFVKLFLTDVPVSAVAFAPDADKVYLLLPGNNTIGHSLAWVALGPLLETRAPLASRPIHLVPIPAEHRMAVSQQHPSGRITFVDTLSGGTNTVTGFELNALID